MGVTQEAKLYSTIESQLPSQEFEQPLVSITSPPLGNRQFYYPLEVLISITTGSNTVYQAHRSLKYHLYSIYLFTRNDFKVILYPQTAVGVFQALAGALITTNSSPSLTNILLRLPLVAFWNWFNLLTFNLANQRLPASVLEDRLNKPWRPIPAGRITSEEARQLLMFVIPLNLVLSSTIGGLRETVAMMILTWMYNDLGGANDNYALRNVINALGFICHGSGSTLIAAGPGHSAYLTKTGNVWLSIVGCIVFSTLQVQDLPDMEGDAARGRRTFPLVHGENVARWSVALFMIFWSGFCPAFWGFQTPLGYIMILIPGGLVSHRVLWKRSVDSDERTYQLWCVWLVLVYLLPLCRNPTVLVESLANVRAAVAQFCVV